MIIFLIIVIMATLFPVDTEFVKHIKDTDSKVAQLTTARQPYLGDWFELNQFDFAFGGVSTDYANNGYLVVSNYDPTERFTFGDRFRLKQGGAYKYYYCVLVYGQNVYLAGDMDTPLVAGAITDIAFSKVSQPIGFPARMEWDMKPGANFTASYSFTGFFSVDGGKVFIDVVGSGTSASEYMEFKLPTINSATSQYQFAGIQDNGNDAANGAMSSFIAPADTGLDPLLGYTHTLVCYIWIDFGAVQVFTAAGFTASGTKGINAVGWYPLNNPIIYD